MKEVKTLDILMIALDVVSIILDALLVVLLLKKR